ncbi:hypothetical protein Lal_00000928 [Lupinus albus]|uniref:Uncharacterized protein n=1 Tax=Lupinus albus TaxID=3870 RepID=A0A6A4MRP3_LUPAL|nr:hypothetical protein Lalb_Chr24g0399901 [Lupinus albus]KAF1859102.1 hypothetical protein Lal_00000928 [Lupinus albus]
MVISLGPGKFYGNSLPRPRFYTDIKFNDHRVDPPISITDPFMSWAEEAHWSMGGFSYKRLRLQGKIEGNANKLRSQRQQISEAQAQSPVRQARSDLVSGFDSPSPPDAPVALKRRSYMSLIENEKEDDVEFESEEFKVVTRSVRRKRLVKKLGEEFDRVASENEGSDGVGSKLDLSKNLSDGFESDLVGLRTRKRRLMKGGEVVRKMEEENVKKELNLKGEKSSDSVCGSGVRTSLRLAKRVKN